MAAWNCKGRNPGGSPGNAVRRINTVLTRNNIEEIIPLMRPVRERGVDFHSIILPRGDPSSSGWRPKCSQSGRGFTSVGDRGKAGFSRANNLGTPAATKR